mgnify:FL=1
MPPKPFYGERLIESHKEISKSLAAAGNRDDGATNRDDGGDVPTMPIQGDDSGEYF